MNFRSYAIAALSGCLGVNILSALPADPETEAEGYFAARIEGMVLPVLPEDPLKVGDQKEIVYDLMVSAQGDLIASGAYYLPRADFSEPMKQAVAFWKFRPAEEAGRKVVGFFRYVAIDYFVVKDRRRSATDIPAIPLWSIDRKLAARINTLCSAREENETLKLDRIQVDFRIDETGAVRRFGGKHPLAKALIDYYFEPARDSLRFQPALRDGKPVDCRLALYLSVVRIGDHAEPLDTHPKRPLPAYPGFGENDASLKVTVVADYDPTGCVASARIVEDVPMPFAIRTMMAIRSWRLSQAENDQHPLGTIQEIHFGFLGDNNEGFLIDPPRPIECVPPVPTRKWADGYPSRMKSGGADGAVEVAYRVDEDGRVIEPVVAGATAPEFADWVLDDLSSMTFVPGRRDGQAVGFRMVDRHYFIWVEMFRITDGWD